MYDIAFVGAGIANLYAAYRVLQRKPDASIIILEATDRVGGRLHNSNFAGTRILRGAGIGRLEKDHLLKSLLDELQIPYGIYPKHINGNNPAFIRECLHALHNNTKYLKRATTTFREFASSVLGAQKYAKFIAHVGYTDFEDADVIDTLYAYGFDDTYTNGGHIMGIDWTQLTNALIQRIGPQKIRTNTPITSITSPTSHIHILNGRIKARRVVIGTTITPIRKLLPKYATLLDNIASQPFIRVYAQIDLEASRSFQNAIEKYTVTPGCPIQKIIPMSPQQGVYMIAYSDNAAALAIRNKTASELEDMIAKHLHIAVKIKKIMRIWWDEGTHFFKPLPQQFTSRQDYTRAVQRPHPSIYVVGEAVSTNNQGWVQGALESVEQVIGNIIIKN